VGSVEAKDTTSWMPEHGEYEKDQDPRETSFGADQTS